MESTLTPEQVQSKVREQIKKKFADLLVVAKKPRGRLSQLASQIGVTRPQLYQYARKGSMPGADVILTAFLKWDWVIEIESPDATPSSCKFAMTGVDKESRKLKQQPVQLSLFDALAELDEQLEVLKKTVARAEAEVEKSLKRA